jgi:hypothetical protein
MKTGFFFFSSVGHHFQAGAPANAKVRQQDKGQKTC